MMLPMRSMGLVSSRPTGLHDGRLAARSAAQRFFVPMSSSPAETPRPRRYRVADSAGYILVVAIVGLWTWRALHDHDPYDTGLAWQAGRLGWATGHPEHLGTWNGAPLLAAAMAILSRLWSAEHTADIVTIVSLGLTIAAVVMTMGRLRDAMRPLLWWVATLGLVSYVPLMSSVWWKQFNVIALTLAAAGFALARQNRSAAGGLALGLSLSIKPMAFMVPLVMLLRRETRRAGLIAISWVIGLNVLAQALFAQRAHNLATLNPTIGLSNLLHKTTAAGNVFLCASVNFSPTATFCRLNGGFAHWTLQRVCVTGLILLFGLFAVAALRGRSARSWEVFAFACPFSIMLSALSWAHYQVMLAPLFLLLFYRFTTEGARLGEWVGLIAAFTLASLMWMPYGTLWSELGGSSSTSGDGATTFIEQYSALAQYIVVITGIVWYARHPAIDQPSRDLTGVGKNRNVDIAPATPKSAI
jgi:hypothetical protein